MKRKQLLCALGSFAVLLASGAAAAMCERHIANNSTGLWTFKGGAFGVRSDEPNTGNAWFGQVDTGRSVTGQACKSYACTGKNGPCTVGPGCLAKISYSTTGGATRGEMFIRDQSGEEHSWRWNGGFFDNCPKIQHKGNTGAVSMNQPADGDYSVDRARWSSDAKHFVRQAKPFKGSLRDLAKAYAPRVHMHPQEEWFPSSVSFFEKYVVRKPDRYTTKMPLDSPSSSDFPGAVGQRPDKASVPVYAVVADNKIEAGEAFTDIVYFMFYPYNRGKQKIDTIWGNHVGDWEHLTVRFKRSNTDYVPVKVSFSVHDTNIELPWGAPDFLTVDTHVVAFEAKGTHAVFPAQGRFVYKNIAVLGSLIDDTGTGVAWDTWNNVVLVTKEASGKYACIGHDGTRNAEDCKRWLNYPAEFRWGNAEEGCIAGQCRLEQGPTGPTTKAAVTDVNRFD